LIELLHAVPADRGFLGRAPFVQLGF